MLEYLNLGYSLKILLLDNEQELLDSYSDFLEERGYEVFKAHNGIEGLQIIKDNQDLDLVITDTDMPLMSGIELMFHLYANHIKHPKIIITTDSCDQITDDIKIMAYEVLSKPLGPEALLAGVQRAMRPKKTDKNS